jgi:hypothetical protein
MHFLNLSLWTQILTDTVCFLRSFPAIYRPSHLRDTSERKSCQTVCTEKSRKLHWTGHMTETLLLLCQSVFNFWVYSRINTPTFWIPVIFIPVCLWRWYRRSVPKLRHVKFRRRGITQKKTYNIQNTAKVWNKQSVALFCLWVAVQLCWFNLNKEFCPGWRVSIDINIIQHTCLQLLADMKYCVQVR